MRVRHAVQGVGRSTGPAGRHLHALERGTLLRYAPSMDPFAPLPADLLAPAALALAGVQAVAASRLDLAPVTVAAVGLAALHGGGGPWLIGAVALGALASARGAARGVGRPELSGLVALALALAAWAPPTVAAWAGPTVSPDTVSAALFAPVVVAAGAAVLLARERRGLRGQRVFHYREVPVGRRGRASAPAAGSEDAA